MDTADSTELRAIKLTGRITKDHRLEVDLPLDVRAGEAEVIVLVSARPTNLSPEERVRRAEDMKTFRAKLGTIHPPLSDAVLEERAEYES